MRLTYTGVSPSASAKSVCLTGGRIASSSLPANELAQEIGDAPARGAAAERDNSLAQHRVLLPCAPPESGLEPMMTCDDVDHSAPVDCGKSRPADRINEMVYGIKQEDMHVNGVAGDQKGQDLSLTVRQEAIAAGHAACDNESRARRGALNQDIYMPLKRSSFEHNACSKRMSSSDSGVNCKSFATRGFCARPFSILRSLQLHSILHPAAPLAIGRRRRLLMIARPLAHYEGAI
jgi:hypothetical protein